MVETKQVEQVSNNLDKLLEDALDDLLLEDDNDAEVKGAPDYKESLKKISQVDEVQEIMISKNNFKKSKDSIAKRTTKQAQPEAGTSSDCPPPSSSKVVDEEEMNKFFASMTEKLKEMPKIDPAEAQARINESVPQIFDLMQNLLSKELLYPALNDLAPKFDEWLQKNLASLSKDDRRRYKKQFNKINEIIAVFDDESLNVQERFEKNLDLMEQMQALGAPPDDLTVPEGMSRCSII